jgi:hypothetical protein
MTCQSSPLSISYWPTEWDRLSAPTSEDEAYALVKACRRRLPAMLTLIRRFVSQSGEWARFCEDALIAPALREAAAGEILFRIDGAAVVQRRASQQATSLRSRSNLLGAFMPPTKVVQAMHLLRRQLPVIEELRGAPLPPGRLP